MFYHKITLLTLICCLNLTHLVLAQSGTKQNLPAMQNQTQTPAVKNNIIEQVKEAPKYMGSITKIETKGKINTLSVEVAGKTQEVIMTPKVKFALETIGDITALKEGVYVETKVNQPNQRSLVVLEMKVFAAKTGKLPTGKIEKAPAIAGESKNNMLVSGKVTSFLEKSAFEGYRDLVIQAGPQTATIQVPLKGLNIQLVETDSAKLKVGDQVELEGVMLKNGKLNVTGVRGLAN